MRNLAKVKLKDNGHIRLVSGRKTMTIDRDDNHYYVYGDCFGSTSNNSMDNAINQAFSHLGNITKII